MKTFADLNKEEIAHILNVAMDDGEWHTPSAYDISIHTQHSRVVYGWCNISKHNDYSDMEVWFNINSNTVKIWVSEYRKGKCALSHHRPINNLKKLSEIISSYSPQPTTP
jgi:hypothetical protein